MKSIIVILCAIVGLVTSEKGVLFGGKCENHDDCKSQQCTPICDSLTESACTMPSWYYLRHETVVPSCVTESYLETRKVGSVPFSKQRRIGHSCHNNDNCESRHCVPMCDTDHTMWRCIESRSFFINANKEVPTCTDAEKVVRQKITKSSEESTEGERKAHQKPVTPKRLGALCAQNSECDSNNCVPMCRSSKPEKEARCIEPSESFNTHKVPVPKCMSRGSMTRFVNEVNPSAADELEEIRIKRSLTLRSATV